MPGLGATGGDKFRLSYGWREARATDSFYRFHVNHTFTHNWQPSLRQSIMDVTGSYQLNQRVSLQATLPLVNNKFSMLVPPLGPGNGARSSFTTNGLGDMTLYAQRWMLDPSEHLFGNWAVGAGMKIPTGNWNVQKMIPNETGIGASTRAVYPPSMQPGDGGTGIIVGINGFKQIRKNRWFRGNTIFGAASYLSNPRDTNGTASIVQGLGVPLASPFLSQLTNSVTDSFNVSTGMSIKLPGTWDKPKLKGLRGRLACEWQGIPRYDLIGGSHGYRQPGYIMAISPGFTYSFGKGYFIGEVPLVFNKFVDPDATAVPGLPVQTADGPVAAPFTPKRNLGLVAPVAVSFRYVRTF